MQEQNQELVLTRGDLSARILEKFGKDFQSKAACDRVVAGVFDEMVACVASGGTVRIDKLGTFSAESTKARTGRNPGTGEPIEIPAGARVKFNAAKPMKDAAKAAIC